MKVQQAREILGDKAIIGTSAHNVAEAVAAEKAGATYLGCGAVFHTSTKHDATLLPYAVLCDIRKAVCIPVVAIAALQRTTFRSCTAPALTAWLWSPLCSDSRM